MLFTTGTCIVSGCNNTPRLSLVAYVFKATLKQNIAVVADIKGACIHMCVFVPGAPGVLPVAVYCYNCLHPPECVTACQKAELVARNRAMASFVCQDLLSMALLMLSLMIDARCNHNASTAGATTPSSHVLCWMRTQCVVICL